MKKLLINYYMKRLQRKALFFLIVLVLPGNLYSQSLIEKLGGATTNFNFISGNDTIPVVDQIIIKRGCNSCIAEDGLEVYILEFITLNEVLKTGFSHDMDFIDADGSIIINMRLTDNNLLRYLNGDNLTIYSISLQHIPLIVLHRTRSIILNQQKRPRMFRGGRL